MLQQSDIITQEIYLFSVTKNLVYFWHVIFLDFSHSIVKKYDILERRCKKMQKRHYLLKKDLNPIQDELFRGCSWMEGGGGVKRSPH